MLDRPTRPPERPRQRVIIDTNNDGLMGKKYSLLDHFDHIYNKRGDSQVRKDFLIHLGAIAISIVAFIASMFSLCLSILAYLY